MSSSGAHWGEKDLTTWIPSLFRSCNPSPWWGRGVGGTTSHALPLAFRCYYFCLPPINIIIASLSFQSDERERDCVKVVDMEGGERRRMLRRDGGGQDEPAIVNPNMLRFRPIAPKPVTNRAGEVGNNENSVASILTSARRKRKYVRVSKNNVCRAKNKDPQRVVTTLQLLPEKNDNNGSSNGESWRPLDPTVTDNNNHRNNKNSNPTGKEDEGLGLGIPMWLRNYMGGGGGSDPTEGMRQMVAVESWVTVECVTGTCMNVQGTFGSFRSRDAEWMKSDLEGDTCPGFISDGQNRVQWLNGAFKRMVSQQKRGAEIAVWLVVKEKLPYADASALITCQVKLQYTVGKERCSRTVPCDLWRMDDGGFAWRLDVNAALTLGR